MRYASYVIVACLLSAGLCFVPGEASASSAGWQEPVWLQLEQNYEQVELIGMDDYGNAMVAWEEPFVNYSVPGIYATRYDALSGWEEAEMVWNESFSCGWTTMAVGPEGDAFVLVHSEIDEYSTGVFAVPYTPEDGWGQAMLVTDSGYSSDKSAAVDAEGNAMLVWGWDSLIMAALYTSGTGWAEAEALDYSGTEPTVKFDRLGNAMAVWSDTYTYDVEAAVYEPGSGWGVPMIASGALSGYGVAMDVNDTGCAMVAWVVSDGGDPGIYANLYTPGVGWGGPEAMAPANAVMFTSGSAVSAGSGGEFFVTWTQTDTIGEDEVKSAWAARWTEGGGWEEPVMLNSGLSTNMALWPSISANTAGQAIATWTDGEGFDTEVMASIYTPGVGWGTAEAAGLVDNVTWMSKVAIAPNGDAIVIFKQYSSGDSYIWSREYYALARPDLTVITPEDGTVTEEISILVRGFTELGVTVTVNGVDVPLNPNGTFETTVELAGGMNEILVIASIEGEGSRGVAVMVECVDPMAVLLAQIDQLMDEIDALTALVDDQQMALEIYEAYIYILEEAILGLADEYETLLGELEETNQALNESLDESAAMEDDIAAFEEEVSSLEDCVTDLEDNVTELESTVAEQEDDASAAKLLQYALIAVIGVLALAVVLLIVQNSMLRKGRGPQGPG